jgi:hypothetical protein
MSHLLVAARADKAAETSLQKPLSTPYGLGPTSRPSPITGAVPKSEMDEHDFVSANRIVYNFASRVKEFNI